jgi:hypothetical protein
VDPTIPLVVSLAAAAISVIGAFVSARVAVGTAKQVADVTTQSQERIAAQNRDLQLAVVHAQVEAQRQIEDVKIEGQRQTELATALRGLRRSQVEPLRQLSAARVELLARVLEAATRGDRQTVRQQIQQLSQQRIGAEQFRFTEIAYSPFHEANTALFLADQQAVKWLVTYAQQSPTGGAVAPAGAEIGPLETKLWSTLIDFHPAATNYIFYVDQSSPAKGAE